jgi:nucleotide-binding universal stress UspA family protein
MKSILIPTDFSETAQNAANYAIDFAKQLQVNHILLLNCLQPVMMADSMSVFSIIDNVDVLQQVAEQQLQNESKRLKDLAPLHITIQTKCILGSIENGVQEVIDTNDVVYIIMGITGGSMLKEKLVGSNTISIAQNTNLPLIIVPADCTYEVITRTMLLCDYRDMDKSLPEKPLLNFLETVQSAVDVLNFDPNFKREEDEAAFEKFYVHQMLRKFSPNYTYSLRNDVEDAVNDLAEINNVQLIINVAKKHGWLYSILHPSFTKKLAFHTKIPLMVIHN